MDQQDFFYLGKIIKKLGKPGEFSVLLDTDDPQRYRDLKLIFIEINQNYIPFFLDAINIKGQKAIIFFDEDPDPDVAELLVSSKMYLPIEALPKLQDDQFFYHEIEGFEVIDLKYGSLGRVESVLDLQKQALIRINYKGNEILVPIADEIIKKINKKKGKIWVATPEGLLDIYQ